MALGGMRVDYRISLVGLCIGFLVGLTGMGGGALLAPVMILLFRVPPVWAVGTDMAYSAVTKAFGSYVHIRQKTVNMKIVLWLACGSVPATILGVGVVQYIRHTYGNAVNGVILKSIGVTLLIVAVLLVVKPYILRRQERKRLVAQEAGSTITTQRDIRWERFIRPCLTIGIGAIVGFLVGLTSVGSGTLIIVALTFLFPRLSSKELVGADIVHAVMLHLAGAILYFQAGTINWGITFLLLLGSLPGVVLGSRLSKYIPDRYMRPLLATVLVISGWKLI